MDHSTDRLTFTNSYYEKRLDLIYALFSRLSMHFNRLALKEKNAMEDQGIQRFNQVKITFSFEIIHTHYKYPTLSSKLYTVFSLMLYLQNQKMKPTQVKHGPLFEKLLTESMPWMNLKSWLNLIPM